MFKQDRKTPIILSAWAVLGICFLFLTPLSQAQDNSSTDQPTQFEKFFVYKDKPSPENHFAASGYMPDGKCVEIDDAWVDNCQESRSCIQVKYDRKCSANDTGWAGAYWLDPANNWGDAKRGGFNLTGATKLVFWARGENGGEVVTFKMGGVGVGHPYPDSDVAVTDAIVLTKDWKEYTVDLTGKNLSHIIGGFSWVATTDQNQNNVVFYLRDIYYS